MKQVMLIGCYGLMYFAFDQWTTHTASGRYVKDYLQNWRTGSFLHLILCAGSVWIIGVCLILATGLALR